MNDDSPITQAELAEVLDIYIKPFFEILGGALAALIIGAAIFIVFFGVRVLWRRVL